MDAVRLDVRRRGPSGQASSIRLTACDPRAGTSPSALWGRSEREQDVSRSAVRIQALVGPDALLVPRVQGGYDPRSRVVMARWGSEPVLRPFEGAWEGASPPRRPPSLTSLLGSGFSPILHPPQTFAWIRVVD